MSRCCAHPSPAAGWIFAGRFRLCSAEPAGSDGASALAAGSMKESRKRRAKSPRSEVAGTSKCHPAMPPSIAG